MDEANLLRNRTWDEVRAGWRDVAPVAVAAIPIGLLFGAVATAKELSAAEVTLMSVLVFAGGAQFAAVEAWVQPAPIAALAFATLLINARHILMGASLAPKLRVSRGRKLLVAWFIVDETWALAERRSLDRPLTAAYWFAMGMILPAAWAGSTALGALLGPLLGDPQRLGADFAFTALFIGLIAGFGQQRATLITVGASAAVGALVHTVVGSPWHVASGALAGIAAASLATPREVAR